MRPQCHGGDLHFVFVLNQRQRTKRIAFTGPLTRKFGARDQIVDRPQHAVEAVVNRVDIHRDGNPVTTRDFRRLPDRRRIVRVDVQHPRAGNLFFGDALRLEAQALRALPQHSSLASGLVDDDVRGLVGTTHPRLDIIQVDPGSRQAFELHAPLYDVA